MNRTLKNILLGLLVLVLLLAGAAIWVLNDEELIRRQIEGRFSQATGRQLTIGGLELDLGGAIRIQLADVRLANAVWGTAEHLLSIGRLDATIDVSRLLRGGILIEDFEIGNARLNLEENGSGQANWELAEAERSAGERPGTTVIPWKHFGLYGFELTHQAPEREVPLEFRIDKLTADRSTSGRVDIGGDGVVGGYELSVDGFVEPLQALLAGGRLSHRLTVRLGEYRLISEGTVDDASTGAGAAIDTSFSGPDFGWLLRQAALPEFSTGPFDVSIDLDVASDRSLDLDLKGDLGSFQATASGRLDRLVKPTTFDLAFTVSGPDLDALGRTLGVEKLPAVPYRSEGELRFDHGALEVERFAAQFGQDNLSVSGNVGRWPGLAGTALDVTASGSDISVWGASMNFDRWQSNPYTVSGRVLERNGEIVLGSAIITLGGAELKVDGSLGSPPELFGARISLDLAAPDLSGVIRTPRAALPVAAVKISGSLHRQKGGIVAENLEVDLDGNRASLTGLLALKPGEAQGEDHPWQTVLAGSRLSAHVALPDARSFGVLFGWEGFPQAPLDLKVEARLSEHSLALEGIGGRLGEARLDFDGVLGLEPRVHLIDMRFSVSGPELRHFVDHDRLAGLPGAFRIEGHLERGATVDLIHRLSLGLGAAEATVSGEIVRLFQPEDGNLYLEVEIPDLEPFHPFLGRYRSGPLPTGRLSLNASVSGNRKLITLAGISAIAGESDLKGHLSVAPGEVPEIVGSFESESLDLSWLDDDMDEAGDTPAAPAGEAPRRLFSQKPLPLLAREPMYVDIGLKAREVRFDLSRFSDINLGLAMTADEMSLQLLELSGQLGERLSGTVLLRQDGGMVETTVQGKATGFHFGLGLGEGQEIATSPPVDLSVTLAANGASMHDLAVTAVGDIALILGKGKIANHHLDLIFSDLLLELLHKLNPFAKESRFTNLECGVAVIEFTEGRAKVDPLVFQTDKIVATSTGEVNLDTEAIDLGFSTRPRTGIGISPGVVINPFVKVGGTLARPSLSLDAAGAAVSGGAAFVTGGLSWLGKSLYNRFLRERDPCGKIAAELRRMQETSAGKP